MFTRFLKDENGAQVIEYALIIAVISIALVVALQPLILAGSFWGFHRPYFYLPDSRGMRLSAI